MRILHKYQKAIALILFFIMGIELVVPNVAHALTSGPAQPEMKGFEPIGNSDMVDLFSGDFSYNIPLLDVGGYPVNLSYHSGASMDDEASWAGYGWNVNAGSLNRSLRGLPDDFNGTDKLEREMSMKDHKTYGGKFSMTLDLLGVPVTKYSGKAKKRKLNLNLTVSVGVKVDNYRGIGMELGVNPGLSLTDYSSGENTKTTDDDIVSGNLNLANVDLSLSSFGGAGINVNSKIISNKLLQTDKTSHTQSIGFGYNSRGGGASLTVDLFKDPSLKFGGKLLEKSLKVNNLLNSFLDFSGDTYTPSVDHPTKTDSYNFSLHLGPELWVAFPGIGLSGFYSKQTVAEKLRSAPAYGSMHSEKGKNTSNALMDFNREKEIPYSKKVKYLPIPIPTYDLYSATSQDGGGQYRIYRGSSGVFFDPKTETNSDNLTLGIEAGAGFYWDGGFDIYKQDLKVTTKKWTDRNAYLSKGDFQPASLNDVSYEPAYFKRVGEPVPYDDNYISKIKGTSPVAVSLPVKIDDVISGAKASDQLRTKTARNGEATSVLKRDKREVRNTTFSYLTSREAGYGGLDKTIKDIHPDSIVISGCGGGGIKSTISRTSSYRKGHHLSEITVTGDDGKRSVYGLPVYNTYQEEVSFSVGQNLSLRNKGLINYSSQDNSIGNQKGRDNYFSKEKTPPYTTSHLLTAILSPDYVDRTGNGVTDDDLGTAVKFNYTKLNSNYQWRTPYAFGADTANYNEGFLSDALDDKANYVYGEKEVWYLHSIESKTMVAHFITEDRLDGLGVMDKNGGVNSTVRLKRLKEIRLYSKSDLKMNGNDVTKTVPIKVVHFVHDYSICQGLPNSVGNTGKLTLKRIYFTFGHNQKGKLNPYDFQYDTSYNFYDYRQYDRWGGFKDAANNPTGLNNSEFPYTLQDTGAVWSNKFASVWQLNKITLPSGGIMNITYEADDYAYVQDKRASQMCMLSGTDAPGSSTNLINSEYIHIKLPFAVSSQKEMLDRYFEGITNLYYKVFLDLDAKGHKEFVPGYAEIVGKPELIGNDVAKVKLKKAKNVNPIAKDGWQFIRTNLPKYAYPGSENIEDQGSDLKKAIKALVTAFGNIKELVQGFDKRAKNKGYSNNLDLSKSWVRLCAPTWKKLGGGSRVKRIDISDDWAAMSGTEGAQTSSYSQVYDYTQKDVKGRTVSTGVASYEPMLGNDENPFRQPVRYSQNEFLGLNNYYYIEEPFGESFFPGASVGYSKVTVKTIGSGDEETVNRTGTIVNEFYTAKDYPTKIDILGLEHRKPITSKIFKLIGGISLDMVGLSQGYAVETNDMHGKPKSTQVYNKSGQKISSVEYFYKSVNELTARKELKNDVKVIRPDGTVTDGSIGMDVEMFTDMRQQITENLGGSVKFSAGSGAILIFPLPFWFPGFGVNYDRRNFRSSSTIKIINRFAIQYKVTKMENGSTITSENLLWDAETGNVLLTKSQNEFDDPVYSFAYPAHWKYNGMGQAYKNLGTMFYLLSSNANGEITNSAYNDLLQPGDELIDIFFGTKYWVINSPIAGVYKNRLINSAGDIQQVTFSNLKLLRSGRRNMANTAIATIASLNNPIVGDKLDVSQLSKVLDAKASIFSEEWSVPVYLCTDCPPTYTLSEDGNFCIKDTIPTVSDDCFTVCQGSHDESYSWQGTEIYSPGYAVDGTGQVDVAITDPSNQFWVGGTCTSSRLAGTATQNKVDSSLGIYNQNVGTESQDSCEGDPNAAWNTTYCGPLHRTSIWTCRDAVSSLARYPYNEWIGFSRCIHVEETKVYYLGIAGDNQVRFYIDGELRISLLTCANQSPFSKWRIYPITLSEGQHTIQMEGYNCGGPAAFGAEIYDNTVQEIEDATSLSNLDLIFSTRNMVGQQFDVGAYSCPTGYTLNTCDSVFTCRAYIPINKKINPYYTGILGNWRAKSSYVYQISRENLVSDPAKKGSTDIRKSGAYSVFSPFWSYSSSTWNQSSDAKWIAANEVTNFNQKGLEVENKDALNRYSAAVFGYLESMPVAVASNSRYREVAYDGFEDYGFVLDCSSTDTCNNNGHFNFRKNLNGTSVDTTSQYSHSGKYSLALNGSTSIIKSTYAGAPGPIFNFDNLGRYTLGSNELTKGFSPIPGKKYVLSFWVKDGLPRDATTTVQATVNGSNLLNSSLKWPVVEGWKRVETQFVLPAIATSFTLQLQSGNTVYLDDIRLHPYDGQMKSFAYDPSSQRLMGELDENNFATFYEYDDEGILIRVKKETERGIMTIKETRSSYKKRQ